MTTKSIFWFRQDLRVSDNPGLTLAAEHDKVMPIYILDDHNPGQHKMGQASRAWLKHSLKTLDDSLQNNLQCFEGDPLSLILSLCKEHHITHVYWNRAYEPWSIARDRHIKDTLLEHHIHASSENASLLWEPWDVQKDDGTPYRVFTPFYRKGCLNAKAPRSPLPAPDIQFIQSPKHHIDIKTTLDVDHSQWTIGEQGAQHRLSEFLQHGIEAYKKGRDFSDVTCIDAFSSPTFWRNFTKPNLGSSLTP